MSSWLESGLTCAPPDLRVAPSRYGKLNIRLKQHLFAPLVFPSHYGPLTINSLIASLRLGCGTTCIAQRLVEKYLAVKTPEGGIALEEQHPRIAQHRRGGLYPAFLAAQFELVGRRVVLQFLAGRKVILSRRRGWRVADSVPPTESR